MHSNTLDTNASKEMGLELFGWLGFLPDIGIVITMLRFYRSGKTET